ncbi:hypothetical protein [Stieleria neptunia]|nr:hypothetical protein [Stieleria neptunia]
MLIAFFRPRTWYDWFLKNEEESAKAVAAEADRHAATQLEVAWG